MNKDISTFYVSKVNGKTELKVFSEAIETLTPQESEVLSLLMIGMKRPQIAKKLSMSTNTVETHLKQIHSKMTVHSDGELIARAFKDKTV